VNANGDEISYSSKSICDFRCRLGHVYSTTVNSRTANGTGCPECGIGKAEQSMVDICDRDSRIVSHEQCSMTCIDDTGRVRKLQADRVLTLINSQKLLIEVDGPHHFGSFRYPGSKETDFEDQVRRDRAKEQAAWSNGWSVLRISYKEFREMEKWISMGIENILADPGQLRITSNTELYGGLYEYMYKDNMDCY
jgi:very-short-patch-repair endonuclease